MMGHKMKTIRQHFENSSGTAIKNANRVITITQWVNAKNITIAIDCLLECVGEF